MVFHPLPNAQTHDISAKLAQSKVIIPTVSFANIPQLATDLLINNLEFVKIGRLDDQYLYPFVSSIDPPVKTDAGTKQQQQLSINEISTSLEVYFSERYNLTLIQQRSPILPSFMLPFLKEIMVPFLTEVGKFREIIVLNSADLIDNYDDYIKDNISIYYSLNFVEKFKSLKIDDEYSNANSSNKKSIKDISHTKSNLVKQLYGLLNEEEGKSGTSSDDDVAYRKLSSIVMYVYEGDNFQDAVYYFNKIIQHLEIPFEQKKKQLVKPYSWLGFYGDKPIPVSLEEGIYG